MKPKRLFQVFVLLSLLFSPFGSNQSVRASTDSPYFQNSIQDQSTLSMVIEPSSLTIGQSARVTVSFNNVPAEGYTSAELTCIYDPNQVEASSIVIGNLFGIDPVTAINGPHAGLFVVAIAGSHGNKATSSGTVIAFAVRALQAGQTDLDCSARASKGDNVLVEIPSIAARLTVLGNVPTPTTTAAMRITIDPGQTTASRIGVINSNETIRYVLNATAGQVLSIKLTAPANEVAIGVNGPTGLVLKPLDASLIWSTVITTSGDHTITLTNLTGSSSAAYTLEVSLTPPSATATPTIPPTACDKAEFIADVNVPPGTVMAPGAHFTKTWRLKNAGTCVWTLSYRIAYFSGEQMGTPSSIQLPLNVGPGQTVDISLNMIAPSVPGTYRGYWIFQNVTGSLFGIGLQGNQPWFVDIIVSNGTPSLTPEGPANSPTPSMTPGGPTDSPTPTLSSAPTATPMPGTYFDFVAQAYTATWSNAEGQLPYPGIDGNPNGFAFKVDNPRLETGAVDTRPGLLMVPQMMSPQNAFNLYIQGSYPPIHVQSGDRFQSTIGCEGGATNCYVGFRLDYQVDGEYPYHPQVFWGPFLERYDGQTFSVNIDLSPLAGKNVKFILTVFADGAATWDRALWVAPIIYRPSSTWTPTPSATPATDWLTFTNRRYGFEFKYPPPGPIIANNDTFATIHLPFVQGTVLQDKSLYVSALENVNTCMGGFPLPQSSENVTINGITFLKQTGQDSGAGHLFRWTSYSTLRNNVCVSLNFVLDSLNPGTPATPPALYDEAAESAIFEQIVATYRWLEVTPTITPEEPPISTPTPTGTLTPTTGTVTGQVVAGKPVILDLFNQDNVVVTSTAANADGTFSLTAPAGTYNLVARASGFLSAMGPVTITGGSASIQPTITLLAGDIDSNFMIDQFDAMTIGMNYNMAFPFAADLNNDGVINVLDLELLAKNYRKTGPVAWQ